MRSVFACLSLIVAADFAAAAEVPLKFIGSMPAVEVIVKGKGPFTFGIDTAAQGIARIDSSVAEKLGLAVTGEGAGSDSSGRNPQRMAQVKLDSLKIGDAVFHDVGAMSRSYKSMPRMEAIDGMLTLNLLRDYLVTIDFAGKVLRFAPGELPANGADVVSYKSDGGVPQVQLVVGDETVAARIDTGNMIGEFVLPAARAEKLEFESAPTVVGRARTISGEMEIKQGRAKAIFRIGSREFRNPLVTFPAVSDVANIGSKAFAHLVLTFDQKNLRLRIAGGQ